VLLHGVVSVLLESHRTIRKPALFRWEPRDRAVPSAWRKQSAHPGVYGTPWVQQVFTGP
jgi:hypothetical protein